MASRQTYQWNSTVLSPPQIAQVIYQAGIHDANTIAQLVSIAQRESGGRAGVHGSASPQGRVSGDRGLFQINSVHDAALMRAGIIHSPTDLFNPVINARAAAFLSGGGNPTTMRQLWGAAGGTWTGSSGGFPPPNFGAVQQAQSARLFNQPFVGGGGASGAGSAGYGYGGGSGVPGSVAAENAYYNSLYAGYTTQLGLTGALTQSQIDNARQQQGFANQLAGYQQNGLDLQGQQLDLENQYQNDLAFLNRDLSKTQQATNLKEWQALAGNIGKLQELAGQGLTQDKKYHDLTVKLEQDINKAAQKWAGSQRVFNQQDYHLALDALHNVLTTEAAKWTEVKRSTHAGQLLAGSDYNQKLRESAFVEGEQKRQANSQATAKGALTSEGHGQDLSAFQQQHGLANSDARGQLNGALENIKQAYQQGRISYQDAARQTATAQSRANLTWRQNLGNINHQAQQAGFDYRGNVQQANQQYGNAHLSYQQNMQNLGYQRQQGYTSYQQNQANLKAQQQMAARTQAYNNALYPLNRAGLANTGAGYAAQLAAQQAGTGYAIDNYLIGGAQQVNDINTRRQTTQAEQFASYNPWDSFGGGGSSGSGSGSGSSLWSTSRRNSSTRAQTGGGFSAQAG